MAIGLALHVTQRVTLRIDREVLRLTRVVLTAHGRSVRIRGAVALLLPLALVALLAPWMGLRDPDAQEDILVLRDLANDTAYDYPYPTASFEPDSVFATRVVDRQSGGRCMMGFLPIVEQQVEAAVASVKAYDADHGAGALDDAKRGAERALTAELWRAWLWPFTAEGSAALDGGEGGSEEEE